MHRIFSGGGWLAVLDIHESDRGYRRSRPLVQQRRVLIILCIHVQKLGRQDLLFHSRMIRPVVGGGTNPGQIILCILCIDVNGQSTHA